MLNKHGLKMIGLKKTVGDMTNGGYYGNHNQVNYDMETGEVWVDVCTQNNWVVYHNKSIITVGNYCNKMTMQELADAIARAVEETKNYKSEFEEE